ncbi:hypothetical protein OSCT_2725 [Oscillochloris trichoides DG-6]|uniref:Uncharacterized protein n=1 Tax=Oscillochloris trichoides DG-6 TaxID=765420 RepID=E1IHC4_9CHLR|nr:hypothetical protein [Oscillochloris trichoides]EFO79377.1 hypothetical protein OSCT_2725 [Oscillochloris trichoides DG-6]
MLDMEHLTPRQLLAAERIQEDEGFAGGLADDAAARVIRWAGEVAVRSAVPEVSDDLLDATLSALRQAARQAARQAHTGQDVLALAQAAFATLAPALPSPAPATLSQPLEAVVALASEPAPVPPAAPVVPPNRPRVALGVRQISLTTHRVY